MKRELIIQSIACLFIILFVYTGLSKLIDYESFKVALHKSPVFRTTADQVAWFIPSVELVIAIMLAIPRWRLKGLFASLILMLGFTGYIIYILGFSSEIPCTCGGVIQEMSWRQHLAFNSFFVLLALIGIMLERRMKRPERTERQNLSMT